METQWEEFTQKSMGKADIARVSLNARGNFVLNQKAVDLLGHPQAIVLLYDKANQLIGLKASSPEVNHAYELKRQGTSQSYFLRAKSFCVFYRIDTADTVVFNDIRIDDGVIILNIANVTEAARRVIPAKYADHFYPEQKAPVRPSTFSTLLRMKMPSDE